jgi:hypothetical protein
MLELQQHLMPTGKVDPVRPKPAFQSPDSLANQKRMKLPTHQKGTGKNCQNQPTALLRAYPKT